MILVTGGAGFIGSNLIKTLNARDEEVWVVDDLSDAQKFENLVDCVVGDYWDKADFLDAIRARRPLPTKPRAILHQGACADTLESDGRYVMHNNFEYSKLLLEYCLHFDIPMVYASSAAVYGIESTCREDPSCERPLNIYGYSKLLFDQYVRRRLEQRPAPVVGLRYFNVYGPRERHKGRMASIVYQLHRQVGETGVARLFGAAEGYQAGEQRRDFVHVDDVVAANLWFVDHPHAHGVFNVGTGRARTFNHLAEAVLAWHGGGEVEYIPFPEEIVGRYQGDTRADLSALRAAGYAAEFIDLDVGVPHYLNHLVGPDAPNPARAHPPQTRNRGASN